MSKARNYILTCLMPEWTDLFIKRNNDYSSEEFEPHHFLGVQGQFADIWRKIWKLKKAMWDGSTLVGEQPREILLDLIGHCFLAIEMLDRTKEPEPVEGITEEEWYATQRLAKAGASSKGAFDGLAALRRSLICGQQCLEQHTYVKPCANAEGS